MEHLNCNLLHKKTFLPSNYNILIVEDSKSVNKILYKTFSDEGFNCYSAMNLKEAYALLDQFEIHYIMLDINLPDGNGYEIIKAQYESMIKIFVLTNEKDEQLRNNAYHKGVIDYIIKDNRFYYKVDQIPKTIEQFEKNKYKTILVVDDSAIIQAQLKDILSNRFYNVITSDNTKEALELLNTHSVDLMLLDIELKGSNGIEFLQDHHNEIVNIKKIPVLVISGNLSAATIRDGLKAGAKDLLKKPYVIEEIVLKVDTWIDYKRKEEESICSRKLLEEYKEAVDGSSLVSKTDHKGIITYVNDKFIALSGFTKEELVGKPHSIVRHPDMSREIFEEMWQTIKEKKSPWYGKVKNLRKDGTFYWVNAYIKPILDVNDEIIEFIAIRYDITELEETKKEIERIHTQTKDSIEYASLIQNALIPSNEMFTKYFHDHFTLWSPKDIVGGDIYLFEELREGECLLMLIDCTGHGVPGAFVTMIVKSLESKITTDLNNTELEISPSKILSSFNKEMKRILKQEDTSSLSNVGFDGVIVYFNKQQNLIKYAGANTPLYYIDQSNELQTIKASRHSVGYKKSDINFEFQEHHLVVEKGMKFYLTTDGFVDQNGGEQGFPYGRRRFQELLKNNFHKTFNKQKVDIFDELKKYQAYEAQNDDITLIGFEI